MKGLQFSIEEIVQIAIKLFKGLSVIHNQGITHQNINPKHILIHRASLDVRIIDFSFGSIVKKFQAALNPNFQEQMIEYISPGIHYLINQLIDL